VPIIYLILFLWWHVAPLGIAQLQMLPILS